MNYSIYYVEVDDTLPHLANSFEADNASGNAVAATAGSEEAL